MKKIFATLGLLGAVCANLEPNKALENQYPFMLWSSTCVPEFEEISYQVSTQALAGRVRSTLYDSSDLLKA